MSVAPHDQTPAIRSRYFLLDAEGDVTRVRFHGPTPSLVDPSAADVVRADLGLLAASLPPKVKLLLDLGTVRAVGSPVLAGLVEVQCKAREQGGLMKLVITQEPLLEIFHVTMLDNHFALYESEERALAGFKMGAREEG